MITEESLRRDVLEYLRTNYSIRLDIPQHRSHYSDTISLRLFRSPLADRPGEQRLNDNRYLLLVKESEELLKRNIVNTDRIKEFGENFFEIVTQDILVLQGNEDIRKGFARIRDQISYRVEELGAEQRAIEEECGGISDKEEILTFLEGGFRSYLGQVRQVSEQYESVNNVQVLTSITIDELYSERLGSEEDYVQHYQPLLEVMQRLKSNMVKLYQELNRCEYYELPLRSVNFLANCKNLLLELEPFLIRADCVFNRLIFHVVRGQKENNRLIGRVFHANSAFANDVICDIFKAFFLAHIFKDHFRAHKARLEQEKELLVRTFEHPNANNDNFYAQVIKTEKAVADVRAELEQLRNVIGMGKDKIMREYLGRKECKKLALVATLEVGCTETAKFARNMLSVLKFKGRMQLLRERLGEADRHVNRTVAAIREQEEANSKPTAAKANLRELNEQIDRRFQESYLLIQEGLLQLEQVRSSLTDSREESGEQYFNLEFFPKLQEELDQAKDRYRDAESEMLNSYQSLRKEKLAKAGEAREEVRRVLEDFSDYFETKVAAEVGHEIRNEDAQCEEIKDYIIKVEKAEFLLNNYVSSHSSRDEAEELRRFKSNYECLLQVYEGSMDERIFESFVEKLNFEAADWKQRVVKIKELTRELGRYVGTLKKLVGPGTKLLPKVGKLVKNRTQLYEVLHDMYEEFVQIYEGCLAGEQHNPSEHGLRLFEEGSYRYVLMLYQFRNRTRAEVEELKDLLLPRRTLNYLLDDLFEPFLHLLRSYASYSEDELLAFTLALEHALNYKTSHSQIIKLYETTLAATYSTDYFPAVVRLSRELLQLREQNEQVLALEQQEVIVYHLKEFKQMAGLIEEHVLFAEAVLRGLREGELRMEVSLGNRQLAILRDKLLGDWKDHQAELEKTDLIADLRGEA
jgi:Asp-tRNA(Asn)/Glu-tRNA(Gln) amidotransferase C subunit